MTTLKRLVVAFLLVGCLTAPAARARGNLGRTLTVVVVPARFNSVQLGMDLIQRHYAVLVAYQGAAATQSPVLHVWDGLEWRQIGLDDFRSSAYLRRVPGRIVLVGDESTLPAVLAEKAGEASPLVMSVPSQDVAAMVNALGKVFSFRQSEWAWFAKRYGMELSDDNAQLRAVSWYDKPHRLANGEVDAGARSATGAAAVSDMPREADIPAADVYQDPAPMSSWREGAEATDALPVK
jgi:hypothetical protein